jgi:hypothetical protein
MGIYSENIRKIVVLSIVLLMLGICGMIVSASGDAGEEDIETLDTCQATNERSIESRSTVITGYLRLCDNWGSAHNGNFGPNEGYNLYLNTVYNSFRLNLINIDSTNRYFRWVNTTLKRGSTPASVIKITQPYSNQTYQYLNEVDAHFYNLEFGRDAEMKSYQLLMDIEFVVVDQNWNYIERTGKIYINLHITSRLRTSTGGRDLKLEAVDKFDNVESLYTGAQKQLISLPNLYSASSYLYDVGFTLKLPSSFTFQSDIANLGEIRTGTYIDPLWLLNNAGALDAKAEVISATFDLAYTQNNVDIVEREVPISIEFKKTMIIDLTEQIPEAEIGTKAGGEFIANAQVYQSTTTESIPLTFKNTGNIDLKDVEVELFTDNAAFFFKSNFYYDENSYSYKTAYGKTVEFGDIAKGATVTRYFSTEIIKNLPPGLYKIPIRYNAKYIQNLIDIELDVTDYHSDIVAARATNNQGYTPFILVNVIEGEDENDQAEPDMVASSTAYLKPGMRNVKLDVTLTNLENYQLNNVNVDIDTGNPTPLQALNEINRTLRRVNAQEKDFTMYAANNPVFSNSKTIYFYVDVYSGAPSGVFDVPVTVTCFDPFNQERSNKVMVPLSILPIPPEFVITDVSTDHIEPNKDFNLTVKVYNCGGCSATNVNMMFNGSSNVFSAKEAIKGPQYISKDHDAEFKFQITAGEVVPGNTYSTSVLLSYEDLTGNFFPFEASNELSIPLYINQPIQPLLPRFVISDVSAQDITPHSNFTLSVKVYNVGDASGKDVKLMFNGSSNLFSPRESVKGPMFIMKNEETAFGFTVYAGQVEPGEVYTTSIRISYEDSLGNTYDFDETPEYQIQLKAKEKEEPKVITVVKEVEPETWELDTGIAMIFLGVFILLSAIAFNVIRMKWAKKGRGAETGEFMDTRVEPEQQLVVRNIPTSSMYHRVLNRSTVQ